MPSNETSAPAVAPRHSTAWAWALLLVIVIVTAGIRIRLLDFPLERDEGEYAYAGQLILQGIPPYELAYNMKLPGTYVAYALIMAVFGQSIGGIHAGVIVVNAVTVVLLFLITRRLVDSYAGVAAAAGYAVLSVSPSVLGMAAHATHFVVLLAIAGVLLLLMARQKGGMWAVAGGGLLFGLAFLMKQHGVFFIFFGTAYVVATEWKRPPFNWQRLVSKSVVFGVFAALPFALTCAALMAWGDFDRFWFWTFTYARDYAAQVPVAYAPRLFLESALRVMGAGFWLWVLGAVGLVVLWADPFHRDRAWFVTGFLAFSFVAVIPGFYFREHYFILIVPAVAILCGVAMSAIKRFAQATGLPAGLLQAMPAALYVAALAFPVLKQREFFFQMAPSRASRLVYGANPFLESLEVAKYIRENASPDGRVAVLGSEPQIYFYSKRKSATGYIYMYGLMEQHANAARMQRELIGEVEAARPEYLVFVNVPTSWLARANSEKRIFDWYQQYSVEHYNLVGVVDILSMTNTEYAWNEQADGYLPRSPYFLLVHRRKTS